MANWWLWHVEKKRARSPSLIEIVAIGLESEQTLAKTINFYLYSRLNL
jgi:hypothetical protein